MYGPADARGMMSVISAQSTARNMPLDAPNSAAPTKATWIDGAHAAIAIPAPPIAQAAQISGLRPSRSDSRDAGMIATTFASTTTTRMATWVLLASVFDNPNVRDM